MSAASLTNLTNLTTMADPWFSRWNYALMESLFRSVPHSTSTDDWFGLAVTYPFLSGWFFAIVFYMFWAKDDEEQARRRNCLFTTLVALSAAFVLTVAIRPWIHWAAPVLNPEFRPLFPRYMWGDGSRNCFPSHSTLAYFTVAVGFWPLKRGLSICLSLLALACVSLPRVYLGGHYPIDVLFSCALGILALVASWRWEVPVRISSWLVRRGDGTSFRDGLFFLWTFELGNGFRGTEFLAGVVRQLWHSSI